MSQKGNSFDAWFNGLNTVIKTPVDDLPKILFIHGNSDYLLHKSLCVIKSKFKGIEDSQVIEINIKDLNTNTFINTFNTRSLLDPVTLVVVDGCEKDKSFASLMEFIFESNKISNYFCFLYNKETVDKKVNSVFNKKTMLSISSIEPDFYQINPFFDYLLKENNVTLHPDAKKMLIESFGSNLSLIENEIKKLSLQFYNLTRPVTVEDIGSSVGVLREDFAFKLRSTIMDGQVSKAHILLKDLLRRGESPLALLGMLSKHCRNSIKVKELNSKGYRPVDISKTIGLQMFLVNGYIRYVKDINLDRFLDSLEACRKADLTFKSSKLSEELVLDSIVEQLCP